MSCEVVLREKIISKTKATRDWINKRDKKFLIQERKNQDELWFVSDKIEKGEIKIKSLIRIYLIE